MKYSICTGKCIHHKHTDKPKNTTRKGIFLVVIVEVSFFLAEPVAQCSDGTDLPSLNHPMFSIDHVLSTGDWFRACKAVAQSIMKHCGQCVTGLFLHRPYSRLLEPPSVAPCTILALLRQEEFSFRGVAGPVTFRVSVYSSSKHISLACLVTLLWFLLDSVSC